MKSTTESGRKEQSKEVSRSWGGVNFEVSSILSEKAKLPVIGVE